MKVKQREANGAVVLDIFGDMHGGPENMEIVNILDRLGEEGKLDTVLNFQRVNFIASNGLGILVRARAHYVSHGGRLCICGANSRVLGIMSVTKLNLVFGLHDSCDEALEALKSQRV